MTPAVLGVVSAAQAGAATDRLQIGPSRARLSRADDTQHGLSCVALDSRRLSVG